MVNQAVVAIFYVANIAFNAIRENKILANISDFTVLFCQTGYSQKLVIST